jgi:hypothetical protein
MPLEKENPPGDGRSARHSCEFGLATASESVIGGSQQFGQRPSADGDAGVGELVEQRRRRRRRRPRDSDVGLPCVIGVLPGLSTRA